jgi:hypothetical protein
VRITFPKLSRDVVAKLYIGTVIAAGAAIALPLAVLEGSRVIAHVDLPFLILAVAVVVGEILPVKLGDGEGELVPSTTFTFALVLFGGIAASALTQLVASTIADRIHGKRLVHWSFNIGQYMLAIGASGLVFELLAGVGSAPFTVLRVAAALIAAAVFFVVNTGTVSTVIALTSGTRVRDEISSELMRQTATEAILLGLAPLAVLAVDS